MFKHFYLFALIAHTAYQASVYAPKCTLALSETHAGILNVGAQYTDNIALSTLISTN